MSNVITIENLGKKYLLRHWAKRESYVALRDVIAASCKSFGRKMIAPLFRLSGSPVIGPESPNIEEFWALKDVSLEVKQGDRIGIIGRNGAGKSTLLKILSRITEPTTGSVLMKGRVASLLEVGTGFHPELSGRENVFLNGAILGMKKAEIIRRFDEIVSFSEVEKFIDTPIKRYSSGMYVRLAFAVAAHLETEILIVDEVLAVGDSEFQKKCIGKMDSIGRSGRTVLFVSHDLSAVNSFCTRAILLQGGSISVDGNAQEVTNCYLSGLGTDYSDREGHFNLFNRNNTYNNGVPLIIGVTIYDHNDRPSTSVVIGRPAKICLHLNEDITIQNLDFGIGFYTPEGLRVTSAATWAQDRINVQNYDKCSSVSFEFDKVPFTPGKIMLSPSAANVKLGTVYDHAEMACSINIVEDSLFESSRKISRAYGATCLDGRWRFN